MRNSSFMGVFELLVVRKFKFRGKKNAIRPSDILQLLRHSGDRNIFNTLYAIISIRIISVKIKCEVSALKLINTPTCRVFLVPVSRESTDFTRPTLILRIVY
jgi:hypothetical protein